MKHRQDLLDKGFAIVDDIYTTDEVQKILEAIEHTDTSKDTFRKSNDLFAIRQFLKEVPATFELIFTDRLKDLILHTLGAGFFVVKSIYFDKPATSNWYVAYHQDLTISVDRKLEIENFGSWTTKQNQYAVQPPAKLLENITTIRIHLDDTDEHNGALRVIPGSHLKQICRPETIKRATGTEAICRVKRGGLC